MGQNASQVIIPQLPEVLHTNFKNNNSKQGEIVNLNVSDIRKTGGQKSNNSYGYAPKSRPQANTAAGNLS